GSGTLSVQVFNVGSADLHVSGFGRVAGGTDFEVASPPPFPLTVPSGTEADFTILFRPSSGGNQTATFAIDSDDPTQPSLQLPASGSSPISPPVVSGISRTTGARGDTITVSGSGFTGVTGVGFGATGASSLSPDTDTQLTAVVPPGSGTVDVTVTTPGGTSATSPADQFTYAAAPPPPVVSGIAPTTGAPGDTITVSGSGFTGVTGVGFAPTRAHR